MAEIVLAALFVGNVAFGACLLLFLHGGHSTIHPQPKWRYALAFLGVLFFAPVWIGYHALSEWRRDRL